MKCEKCHNDFSEGVKAAYKLGLMDGEKKAARTIALLRTTNVRMWTEFEHLSETTPNPYDPDVININLKTLLGLLRCRGRSKKNTDLRCYYYKKIEEVVKAQVANLPEYIE